MLFFTALRARCASSEQRALLKPETTTTSCEARKLLPATEGKKLDQVTLSLGLGIPDSRKRVAKHLGPCISAWTRRLKSEELDQPHQQQLRIADLRNKRKCERLCGLRVLSSDINGKRKQHDQVKHLGPLLLTGRNASSHRCFNLGCCTSKLAPGNPVFARKRNSSEGRLSHVWRPRVHEQAGDGRRALAHGSHAHRVIGFPGCTALPELIHKALQHVHEEVQ